MADYEELARVLGYSDPALMAQVAREDPDAVRSLLSGTAQGLPSPGLLGSRAPGMMPGAALAMPSASPMSPSLPMAMAPAAVPPAGDPIALALMALGNLFQTPPHRMKVGEIQALAGYGQQGKMLAPKMGTIQVPEGDKTVTYLTRNGIPFGPPIGEGSRFAPTKQPTELEIRKQEADIERVEAQTEKYIADREKILQKAQEEGRVQLTPSEVKTMEGLSPVAVQKYNDAVGRYNIITASLEKGDNPYANLRTMFTFMNDLDPDSVVREGEQASFEAAVGRLNVLASEVRSLFKGGKTISREMARQIEEAMRIPMEMMRNRARDNMGKYNALVNERAVGPATRDFLYIDLASPRPFTEEGIAHLPETLMGDVPGTVSEKVGELYEEGKKRVQTLTEPLYPPTDFISP